VRRLAKERKPKYYELPYPHFAFQGEQPPPCSGLGDLFFADEHYGDDTVTVLQRQVLTLQAKEICHGCPVKVECYDFAMEHRLVGIWGATTGRERRCLRGECRHEAHEHIREDLVELGLEE